MSDPAGNKALANVSTLFIYCAITTNEYKSSRHNSVTLHYIPRHTAGIKTTVQFDCDSSISSTGVCGSSLDRGCLTRFAVPASRKRCFPDALELDLKAITKQGSVNGKQRSFSEATASPRGARETANAMARHVNPSIRTLLPAAVQDYKNRTRHAIELLVTVSTLLCAYVPSSVSIQSTTRRSPCSSEMLPLAAKVMRERYPGH